MDIVNSDMGNMFIHAIMSSVKTFICIIILLLILSINPNSSDRLNNTNSTEKVNLVPVPLRFSCNVMTLHWHSVNVNKMSTRLKLRPTNASDIVLTFSLGNSTATDVSKSFIGRDCFHTHCCCREQNGLCIVTSQIGVDRFPHRCFSSVSYWFSSKLEIFHLDGNVYLYHLTNILHVYCGYFPSSSPEVNF